ncbi:MAG: Mini-ribonuclease 3 [Firmicutes bacterium]|nr:Mini-ribonuclease 3 [Bacillota bacterium]
MEKDIVDYSNHETVSRIPPGVLAYIGDAVYELYVRESLIKSCVGGGQSDLDLDKLHNEAVLRVCATAQARAFADLESYFTADEADVARRARNIKAGRGPRSMPVIDYRYSTGFEAVIGYLYLCGRDGRLKEIMERALNAMEVQ